MLVIDSARTTYHLLGDECIWATACRCHEALELAQVPHAIIGGVAVCLHGYRRGTPNVDLLISADATQAAGSALNDAGIDWNQARRGFAGPSNVPVRLSLSPTMDDHELGIRMTVPDVADSNSLTVIEGLPTLTLPRLIELKLAWGLASSRRINRDFADVLELIHVNCLQREFNLQLHAAVRDAFLQLSSK